MRKIILICLLVIPWLTIPFLGKNTIKKFSPAATFIIILTKVLDIIGKHKKWWYLRNENFIILGPFLITTFWIMKFTFGKFIYFLLINGGIHLLFVFQGERFLSKYKIFSLEKLNRLQYFLVLQIRALILYGFQTLIGNLVKRKASTGF
ncbi:hypothetical protein M3589_15010 [Heyndrickxia oleronia]|uniref:hypothetical protein n=1 Tax=Heyndrickxia oleronia TaxID=38875 RepID=UPI002041D5CC|nr:hypothetical protein [Heyndrickxia oleronia]MCM3239032.1 hypothetical protein [Heyndrickxia oleronia]